MNSFNGKRTELSRKQNKSIEKYICWRRLKRFKIILNLKGFIVVQDLRFIFNKTEEAKKTL